MKNIVIVFISIVFTNSIYAQIEDIKVDSSFTINRLYAGILTTSAFATDSFHTTNDVNIRVGAMATWKVNKVLSFSGFGVYERSTTSQQDITAFFADIKPTDKLLIRIGKSPTVGSFLHRAHPVSGYGHFETWVQAKVPGAAPAATVMYGKREKMVLAGVSHRAGDMEYQIGGHLGKYKLSGVYQASNKQFAAAFTISQSNLTNTFVWKQDETIANLFYYTFDTKRKISIFADLGYGYPKQDKMIRNEIGFLKAASSKRINALLSVSYDAITKTFNLYSFIYL